MGKKLVKLSFKELAKLVELLNLHGLHPIIIGGWAVYFYVRGAGSTDVDLLLPSKYAVKILEEYCKKYGFKKDKTTKTRVLFKKEIKTGKAKIQEIELDIFTFSDKNLLASNKLTEIPWKLAEKNSSGWEISKKAIARVPSIEVLLLYKAAALEDRKFKLKTWANLPKFTRDRIKSKIAKDGQDIQALLKQGLNKKLLEELLEETKFKKHFEETIGKLKWISHKKRRAK